MKSRAISALVGIVGLSIGLMAQSARADNFEVIVKYGGTIAKMPGAVAHDAFQGLVMPTGPMLTFIIQNANPGWGKPEVYAPDPKLDAAVKAFQPGDLMDIVYGAQKGRGPITFTAVTPYKAQAGEDDPKAWVFDELFPHKVHGQDIQVITLMKYKQKTMFLVPTHADPDNPGDMLPDDVIMGIAGKLQHGQVVFAQVSGSGSSGTIRLLAPWANHFTGKFVKFDTDAVVNTDTSATGPAVELTDASGKAVTALIPGAMQGKKWMPNNIIVAQARRLKPDADVEYLTADSGDNRIWLVSIAAPKPEKSGITRNTNNQ